ncbi:MAG: MucB/RseB C-terminal domain-containing protein [Gammaproteobacteria bacterium]|nr:MucB/RseB C-terminal domain-containing protein [Gammaproteobacteria bacterium]
MTQSSLLAEQMRESISAMVDDEAQQLELQRVLKAAETDPAVREKWQRYQLVSGILKRQVEPVSWSADVADRVSAAVAGEAPLSEVKPAVKLGWWKPLGGFAIAASATMMMVLGVQQATLISQTGLLDDSGIVLIEPGQSNNQFEQASAGVMPVAPNAKGQLLNGVTAIDGADALWSIADLPEDFVLVQRSLDDTGAIAREALRFSNGSSEFTLYVEPLMGRTIAEGHAYAGQNLVLGQALAVAGSELFITLVGELPLVTAQQITASVVVNTKQ